MSATVREESLGRDYSVVGYDVSIRGGDVRDAKTIRISALCCLVKLPLHWQCRLTIYY